MYGLMLLLLLLIIMVFAYLATKDFFSPLFFYSFFQILRYVPYLFNKSYEALTFQELTLDNTFYTFLFEIVSILSVVTGYLFFSVFRGKKKSNAKGIDAPFTRLYTKHSIFILFFLGILGRVLTIKFAGGVSEILTNGAQAYSKLDNGTGYISLLSNFAIVACLMQLSNLIVFMRARDKKSIFLASIVLVFMYGIYSVTFIIFTARSPILELLLYLVIGIHYGYKKFTLRSFLNKKFIVAIAFVVVIVVVLPRIRVSNYESVSNSFSLWDFFDQFTMVGRDTFVYNTFGDSQPFWYGKSYLNLFTSFIPSSFFPNKPSVDDGVYLANLIYGFKIDPQMTSESMQIKYSIPFTTSGLAFANFGLIGLVLANFLLGFLFAFSYKRIRTRMTVFGFLLYALIIYQLEFTTLSIVQTLMPALICIFSRIVFGNSKSKKYFLSNSIVRTN